MRSTTPRRPGRRTLRRRLGMEYSPLRRGVDHAQHRVGVALIGVLLLVAPVAAAWLGVWAHTTGSEAERRERGERSLATATVTRIPSADERYPHQTVQAAWTSPNGEQRGGTLPAWQGARVGDTHDIWVDRRGEPAIRPRPHSRTVADASYAAVAGALGAAVPIGLVYGAVRHRCDRRRYALWDTAWERMNTDAGNSQPQ